MVTCSIVDGHAQSGHRGNFWVNIGGVMSMFSRLKGSHSGGHLWHGDTLGGSYSGWSLSKGQQSEGSHCGLSRSV